MDPIPGLITLTTSTHVCPRHYWLIVKNWKVPNWPGICIGVYASQECALANNHFVLEDKRISCGGCGYFLYFDARETAFYDRGCWNDLGPVTAFEWLYKQQRTINVTGIDLSVYKVLKEQQ